MNTARAKALLIKTLPVVLLAAVLLLVDIAINRPDSAAATSDMLPRLPQASLSPSSSAEADAVLALYQQFDAPAAIVATDPEPATQAGQGLSQQQQDAQQGLLRALYIDNKMYRLTAVVNQRQAIANLTVTDVQAPNAPPQRLALQKGDTLHQYEVVSVTARRITFRHQQRELWLQLFTPEPADPVANNLP
ncbi:hypothetical protein WG68_03275 [Arsukibacterium ikkense]|uniref:Uncharacterized protein n=1 Tax=Arsukibacterium ikkense TaxID=336831 RepID=A0A0M2VCX3_9GAMM|nr:hypothetical protein [Arsukibacterium ikkense]KKO46968.1 hypothetical protein WG68_03275 [Arsukibacterium ikkense]